VRTPFFIWVLLASSSFLHAERINQDGRILGTLPPVTNSILFNTTNADAVVSAMQIFPVTHAWNEIITGRPVATNSDAMIAQISADLASTRRTLRAFQEMNFVLIPTNQPKVAIKFWYAGDESDLDGGTNFPNYSIGLYPIPSNMPFETWPSETGSLTLQQWQQDINNSGGDRHSIVIQPGTGLLWETWMAQLTNSAWQAANGAKWDMNTNGQRPAFWTSADAAGLPMFGGLGRFDECQRGMVEHALRIVVAQTRNQFIYPASHRTGSDTNPNRPAMGQRLRLKSSYVISNSWTLPEKGILNALKKYGALVSDNGNFFSISVVPDDRWAPGEFSHLSTVGITNFEVIQSTGPNEGPRSPGAPVAFAGPDQSIPFGQPAQLQGFVAFTNTPTTNVWKKYSGPGTVTFGNASQTNTTATFSAAGTYTLMLSGEDGVHAVAYDAMIVTVNPIITLTLARAGTNAAVSWSGGNPPFTIEKATNLAAQPPAWTALLTTNGTNAQIPISASPQFFRVRGP